jgi:hypothetical protein
MALIRHTRTPYAIALRLTQTLGRDDLETVRRDTGVPRLVRVAAERRIAATSDADRGESWIG